MLSTHLANHAHASEVVEVLYSNLVTYKARSSSTSETRPPPQTLIRSTKKSIVFSSVLGLLVWFGDVAMLLIWFGPRGQV
jgi:hypothetical protein